MTETIWNVAPLLALAASLLVALSTSRFVRAQTSFGPRVWSTAPAVTGLGAYYLITTLALPLVQERTLPTNVETIEGDIGLTVPNEILRYRYRADLATFCANPNDILEALSAALNDPSRPKACSASLATSEFGPGSELHIRCQVGDPSGACQSLYIARIWAEREAGSTTDYVLRGFGWFQRSCGDADASRNAPELRRLSRGTSDRIRSVIDKCRR